MANKNFIVKNGLDVGGNVSANSRYTFDYNDHYLEAGTNSVAIKNGSGTSLLLANNTGVTVAGNLTVNGTTTTINTATLEVEDNNITLNKGSGDTSSTANGSGITVQDAVNSSTDATFTWNAGNDNWVLSHDLVIPNKVRHTGDLDTYISFANPDDFRIVTGNSTRAAFSNSQILFNQENNNQDFRVDGTNDNLLFCDASGNKIGIGTASPLDLVHLNSASGDVRMLMNAPTDSDVEIKYSENGTVKYTTGFDAGLDSFVIGTTNVDTSRRLVIDSSGDIGIGTDNPSHKLDVFGSIRSYASGSGNAWLYAQNDNKVYLVGVRGSSPGTAHAYSIYDLTADKSRFRVNSDGGIAIGEDNAGYTGQILSVKAGTGNNVLYGESSDADCIVSLRDNSSTANIGFGATGNAHVFKQDGTEVARISTGSADKYSYNGAGLGGSGTNLHLGGDDSEIKMANNFIHSDNSGLTKFTIRTGYGSTSTGAELSLDGGYISLNTGTSFTERMRVLGNGVLLFHTDSQSGISNGTSNISCGSLGSGQLVLATNNDIPVILNRALGSGTMLAIRNNGSNVGSITQNGSSTSFNTSSDYRLKENVNYSWDATSRLKQLKPVRFNFKSDKDTTLDGFLAHEVSSIVPEAITGTKDEVDGDGNPEYQGIDQSKLIPLLVKTIQELEARVKGLEG